ncbi:MAG TPA: aldehyde dehydrogenase family protein, partial [Terriglobales bacterium]|nr:aldehyde dehydrogenase family protein [Terriglobales bacterium]
METQKFLLNGAWVAGRSSEVISSPYDGSEVGRVYYADKSQLEAAIAGSVEAFSELKRMPAQERARILRVTAEGLSKGREDFARLIAEEAGKPIKAARAEVERAIITF